MKPTKPKRKKVCRPPSAVRLVVFDLDGTLVDAFRAIADSLNYTLQGLGLPTRSLYAVKRAVGWGVDTLIRSFVAKERADEALAIFRAHHDQRLHEHIRLLPGAKSLLAYLRKRGCIMAIASNRPEKFCRIILSELGIIHYFDHIVCGDNVKRAKPHPDMVKAILKAARVKSSEAVFVGDMSVDVLCGKRAGLFTVGIPTGSCTREEIAAAGPDVMIEHLSEVKKYVGL